MADNSGLFVKMWVKMLDDDWFISLNCTERGLWCQLLIYAKRMGDSGTMSWRSWGHFSQNFGITRTKAVQICTKMQQLGKIKIRQKKGQNNYIFEISIPNYKYYQGLRAVSKLSQSGSKIDNFGSGLDTQDIDIDKNRIDIEKESANANYSKFIKLYCDSYLEEFKTKYIFEKGKDGKIVKTLLEQFDYELLCKMVPIFFKDKSEFVKGHKLDKFKYQSQGLVEEVNSPKKNTLDEMCLKAMQEVENGQ